MEKFNIIVFWLKKLCIQNFRFPRVYNEFKKKLVSDVRFEAVGEYDVFELFVFQRERLANVELMLLEENQIKNTDENTELTRAPNNYCEVYW